MVLQLLLFAALTGIAMAIDYYFEKNPEAVKTLNTGTEGHEKEQGVIYLFTQANNFGAKSPVQKITYRKFLSQEHDKLIRQCHQLRNHQAWKAENKLPRKPLYLTCRNLIFRQYYFSVSGEEPPLS